MMPVGIFDAEKYAARGDMTQSEAKFAIRERDGNCCRKCGMTDEQHIERYGKSLDIHRKEPGSLYTLEGCVLLCRACHGPEAKRAVGEVDRERGRNRFTVSLPVVFKETLAALFKKNRREITVEVQLAIIHYAKMQGVDVPDHPVMRPTANDRKLEGGAS